MSSLQKKMIILVIFTLALSACGGGNSDASSAEQALTQVAQNVSMGLTQTADSIAAAQPSPTVAPPVTDTPAAPLVTPTSAPPMDTPAVNMPPAADLTALPPGLGTSQAPQAPVFPTEVTAGADQADCKLRVSMEWENIPDDTEIAFSKEFTKTWRLKNIGTCEWPAGTELTFVSGDLMNASSRIVLLTKALPVNQYVEAIVDFKAPNDAGTYQASWMLVTPQGRIFGTGDNGKGTFWVRIVAYDKATQKKP